MTFKLYQVISRIEIEAKIEISIMASSGGEAFKYMVENDILLNQFSNLLCQAMLNDYDFHNYITNKLGDDWYVVSDIKEHVKKYYINRSQWTLETGYDLLNIVRCESEIMLTVTNLHDIHHVVKSNDPDIEERIDYVRDNLIKLLSS